MLLNPDEYNIKNKQLGVRVNCVCVQHYVGSSKQTTHIQLYWGNMLTIIWQILLILGISNSKWFMDSNIKVSKTLVKQVYVILKKLEAGAISCSYAFLLGKEQRIYFKLLPYRRNSILWGFEERLKRFVTRLLC